MASGIRLQQVTAIAAGLVALAVSGPAQAAGLFDFLFGPSEPPARTYYRDPSVLDVRVNPRKKAKPVAVSPAPDRKATLAAAIDPVKNPQWYLDDPTLRRGDIVVLKGQVIVYDGGKGSPRMREDFTSLEKSPYLSKAERELLRKSAGIAPNAGEPKTPPAKQATLKAGE